MQSTESLESLEMIGTEGYNLWIPDQDRDDKKKFSTNKYNW